MKPLSKNPLLLLMVLLFCVEEVRAQSTDARKFELGAQFTMLGIDDPQGIPSLGLGHRSESGFGFRITYNINTFLALDAEGNFFPRDYKRLVTDFTGGRISQGLFGLKAGIHKRRIGFFGKIRPGFVSSSKASRTGFPNGNGPDPNNRFGLESIRATQLALDLGGVVELYPTTRAILRFDVGDTVTRYPNIQFICFPAGVPCPEDVYRHRLQFSAGVGFRF